MLIQINGTSGAEIFSFKGKWQAISESVFHSYKACRGSNEKNRCQKMNRSIARPNPQSFRYQALSPVSLPGKAGRALFLIDSHHFVRAVFSGNADFKAFIAGLADQGLSKW